MYQNYIIAYRYIGYTKNPHGNVKHEQIMSMVADGELDKRVAGVVEQNEAVATSLQGAPVTIEVLGTTPTELETFA